MKRIIAGTILVVLIAAVTQWVFIHYVPAIIYKIAVHRSQSPANVWIHAPKTTDKLRRVVLPNPDFVYSALFYDVSEKDLVITGALPTTGYASVSFYDDRCQPYYVYNNYVPLRQGQFWFKLTRRPVKQPNNLQVKTNKGVIICRFLMTHDSAYQSLTAYQHLLQAESK